MLSLKKTEKQFLFAVLPVCIAAFYYPVFFMAMKWDMVDAFLPMRKFISDCFHHGIFPAWNPYINFGFPVAADLQSGLFYPFTWLWSFTFGYNAYTIQYEYLFHVYIGAAGMYLLARRLDIMYLPAVTASLAYSMCGVMTGNAQHLSWIIAAAWLPWLFNFFYAFLKSPSAKSSLTFALVLYLLTTGGYPAFLIVSFYLCLLYSLIPFFDAFRKKDFNWITSVLLFGTMALLIYTLLTAGYFYNYFQSIPFIPRSHEIGLSNALFGSVTKQSLWSVLWPKYLIENADHLQTDVSMASIYFSVVILLGLILFFFKQQPKIFYFIFCVGVLTLCISMPSVFPLREWLYDFVPLMNRFRFPAMFRLFSIISFLLCGAMGWQKLFSDMQKEWAMKFVVLLLLVELMFTAKEMIPFTVVSDVPLKTFAAEIDACPNDFPVPHKKYSEVTQAGNGSLAPAYNNCSVYERQPAPNGYYPFYLNGLDSIDQSPFGNLWKQNNFCFVASKIYPSSALKLFQPNPFDHAVVFINNYDTQEIINYNNQISGTEVSAIKKFLPAEITVLSNTLFPHLQVLMQQNYPGWKVTVDGKTEKIFCVNKAFIAVKVEAGFHSIVWKFDSSTTQILFYLTIVLFVVLSLVAIKFRNRISE